MQVESVGAAERGALHEQAVEDHGERQRQHGEEDVAVTGQQQAEQRRDHRRAEGAGNQHRSRVGDVPVVREQRRGIGADAEVETLSERYEPGAHQHQQAQHNHALGQHQHGHEHQPLRRQQSQRAQPGDGSGGSSDGDPHILRASCAANSPLGRAISTSAITA